MYSVCWRLNSVGSIGHGSPGHTHDFLRYGPLPSDNVKHKIPLVKTRERKINKQKKTENDVKRQYY